MKKLIVSYVCPPIPVRDHDWCVYLDGDDEDGPFSFGESSQEALQDYLHEYADDDDDFQVVYV